MLSYAYADDFSEVCSDISSCVKAVSELTNQKYIFDSDIKGKVKNSPNLELTKENAELLLTHMLYLNGYTRVPLNQTDTFQILRLRDARDTLLPVLKASATAAPVFPNTWDLYEMDYSVTYIESMDEMIRVARAFLPAHARLIPVELSKKIIVTAAVPDLKKVYDLLKDTDQQPSSLLKKKWVDRGLKPLFEHFGNDISEILDQFIGNRSVLIRKPDFRFHSESPEKS